MRLVASLVLAVALGAASTASAQAPSASDTAVRVHHAGGYPDDISVLERDRSDGSDTEGIGGRPEGPIGLHGDRDGGDAGQRFDVPLPDFVRDLLTALAQIFGAAAMPIGYAMFAIGIGLAIALVVYLVVMMRRCSIRCWPSRTSRPRSTRPRVATARRSTRSSLARCAKRHGRATSIDADERRAKWSRSSSPRTERFHR